MALRSGRRPGFASGSSTAALRPLDGRAPWPYIARGFELGGCVMQEERHSFQAEVGRLLDIVAHSLYSDRSVFLRELVSNASDAYDRLRYLTLTRPELAAEDAQYRVVITPDAAAKTLTIADNGIG